MRFKWAVSLTSTHKDVLLRDPPPPPGTRAVGWAGLRGEGEGEPEADGLLGRGGI